MDILFDSFKTDATYHRQQRRRRGQRHSEYQTRSEVSSHVPCARKLPHQFRVVVGLPGLMTFISYLFQKICVDNGAQEL